jgi:hypothetical protein
MQNGESATEALREQEGYFRIRSLLLVLEQKVRTKSLCFFCFKARKGTSTFSSLGRRHGRRPS